MLARVEGEGGIRIRVRGDRVEDVRLNIFEPPRFFEAFLRGRHFTEAPDLTARICGICPVAYQMSSCQAMEAACGVRVEGPLRQLRRLLYCGEWIESHVLHVYMLHAPDFLGYPSAVHMAADHPAAVERALALKKLGNALMEEVGGRAVHPINVRLGGFYRLPRKEVLRGLRERLLRGRDEAVEMVRFAASLPVPDFERDYELVALHHPEEYPITAGRLVSNRGLDIAVEEFPEHFREEHVAHSNALHCRHLHGVRAGTGTPYFVGPLARYALAFDQLSPLARETAREVGLPPVVRNPFRSIAVRAVETLYAFDEAVRILDTWEEPDAAAVPVEIPPGGPVTGCGVTEAPRGILFHRYTVGEDGRILAASIVPPTAQNQPMIEEDLRLFVGDHLDLPEDELTWQCEQAVRNYDPCISCATHFLKLELDRR